MYKSVIKSKTVFYGRGSLLYDCRLQSTVENVDTKCTSASTENLKSFEDIPGPKSYPMIGTLYKYFPLVGE